MLAFNLQMCSTPESGAFQRVITLRYQLKFHRAEECGILKAYWLATWGAMLWKITPYSWWESNAHRVLPLDVSIFHPVLIEPVTVSLPVSRTWLGHKWVIYAALLSRTLIQHRSDSWGCLLRQSCIFFLRDDPLVAIKTQIDWEPMRTWPFHEPISSETQAFSGLI